MPGEPDLRFDIDALFAHISENLERDPEAEAEWHFTFRSEDLGKLTRVGEQLADEFDVFLQEQVETVEEGRTFMGPPLMAVVIQAALGAAHVKELSEVFAGVARDEGLTYEGVSSFEAMDEESAFGWLDLESAVWRLRSFTDSGLGAGEPVPFVFAMGAGTAEALRRAEAALEKAGFRDLEIFDEEDDEEGLGIIVHVEGRNEEALLAANYRQVERIASAAGAELIGVQFFEPDDGLDDEDDEFDDDDDEDLSDDGLDDDELADRYADDFADEFGGDGDGGEDSRGGR